MPEIRIDPDRTRDRSRYRDAILRDDGVLPDMKRMVRYRYKRLQDQIVRNNCAGALITSSANLRYATGTSYAQVQNMQAPFRAVFVPAEGKAVLYDWELYSFGGTPEVVGERRDAFATAHFISGSSYAERTHRWADDIADLVKSVGGAPARLAIDMCEPELVVHLTSAGVHVINAEKLIEHAASVKSDDELCCIAYAVSVAEAGLARIRESLRPGISEQALWAHLADENAKHGGEWFNYRMLTSGERTNPWGRECSGKIIETGELVGVDTGMVGPFGYCADISRTFLCGPGRPTPEQRELYTCALENMAFNTDLIRAGMTFREIAEKSWQVPDIYWSRRYNSIAHGVGMGNEWPLIPFRADSFGNDDDDTVLEENMVLAVESCIGREDGHECVKLEDMVIVKDGPCQLLSTFPFETELMG